MNYGMILNELKWNTF